MIDNQSFFSKIVHGSETSYLSICGIIKAVLELDLGRAVVINVSESDLRMTSLLHLLFVDEFGHKDLLFQWLSPCLFFTTVRQSKRCLFMQTDVN